jgi:hypothetical protein
MCSVFPSVQPSRVRSPGIPDFQTCNLFLNFPVQVATGVRKSADFNTRLFALILGRHRRKLQSVALFLQKCVKIHLLASVTPQIFSVSLTLAMRQGLCPPQYFCQVYAYAGRLHYLPPIIPANFSLFTSTRIFHAFIGFHLFLSTSFL